MKLINFKMKLLISIIVAISIICISQSYNCVSEAAELKGKVFDDLNANGVLDEGEPGIANVIVLLNVIEDPVEAPVEKMEIDIVDDISKNNESTDSSYTEVPSETITTESLYERASLDTPGWTFTPWEEFRDSSQELNQLIEKSREDHIIDMEERLLIDELEAKLRDAWMEDRITHDSTEEDFGSDVAEEVESSSEKEIIDVYSYMTTTDANGDYVFNPGTGAGTYEIMFLYGGREQLKAFAKYNAHDYEATVANALDGVLENKSYFMDDVARREEVNGYINTEIGYDLGKKLSALDNGGLTEADYDIAEGTYMKTQAGSFVVGDANGIVENLNLGLRERKTVDIKTTQYISKLEIILNNGEVLAEAEFDENGNYLNGEKEIQNIMMLPDRISPIIDDEIIHGATMKITYKVKVESKARGYWENEEEKAEFSRITVYEYLEGGMQAQNVDFRKISESECARLEPVKEINNIYCADVIIGADETKELELVTSMMLTTELDYKFDSSMEMVSYQNTANRRMYNVIPGNYEPEAKSEEELGLTEMLAGEEPRELEADEAESIRVTIIPPL